MESVMMMFLAIELDASDVESLEEKMLKREQGNPAFEIGRGTHCEGRESFLGWFAQKEVCLCQRPIFPSRIFITESLPRVKRAGFGHFGFVRTRIVTGLIAANVCWTHATKR
jgi:hypothetical protein